jgi:hypothetical protein
MSASDTVPVIVGAAIGAGGAVIAQVTSAVFTARRETARLIWEKERQAREWKMREDERFLHLKQELYASYAVLAHRFWITAENLVDYHDEKQPESQKPEMPDWNELERLESTVRLLAPKEVSEAVADNYSKVLEAVECADNLYKEKSTKAKMQYANRALDAWWVMYRAMRADLHGPQGRSNQTPKP